MNLALLWADAVNKSSLISESGAETLINIHLAEKIWQHDTRKISKTLHVATICDNDQGAGSGLTSP
jgi:hypothetical protein